MICENERLGVRPPRPISPLRLAIQVARLAPRCRSEEDQETALAILLETPRLTATAFRIATEPELRRKLRNSDDPRWLALPLAQRRFALELLQEAVTSGAI